MGFAQPTESDAGSLMTRPLPIEEPDDDDEQERLNAHRSALRARLIEQDMGTGSFERDVFSEPTKAPR
jgi:hypothetical protein